MSAGTVEDVHHLRAGDQVADDERLVEHPFQRSRIQTPGEVEERPCRGGDGQSLVCPHVTLEKVPAAVQLDSGPAAADSRGHQSDLHWTERLRDQTPHERRRAVAQHCSLATSE
jgi:hypothetical protein